MKDSKRKIRVWNTPLLSKLSLVIGIILTVVSALTLIRQQEDITINRDKSLKEIEKLKYELNYLQNELKTGESSFYVQYISMEDSIFNMLTQKNEINEKLPGFWSSPVLNVDKYFFLPDNDINWKNMPIDISDNDGAHVYFGIKNKSIFHNETPEINCLLLIQDGKRRADEIEMEMEKVNLIKAIPIFDSTDLVNDFWKNDLPKEIGIKEIKIFKLGSLEPGKSLIIPLFKTYYFYNKKRDFSTDLTLGTVYIPKKIYYKDNITGKKNEFSIRKMLENSIMINAFIKGHG